MHTGPPASPFDRKNYFMYSDLTGTDPSSCVIPCISLTGSYQWLYNSSTTEVMYPHYSFFEKYGLCGGTIGSSPTSNFDLFALETAAADAFDDGGKTWQWKVNGLDGYRTGSSYAYRDSFVAAYAVKTAGYDGVPSSIVLYWAAWRFKPIPSNEWKGTYQGGLPMPPDPVPLSIGTINFTYLNHVDNYYRYQVGGPRVYLGQYDASYLRDNLHTLVDKFPYDTYLNANVIGNAIQHCADRNIEPAFANVNTWVGPYADFCKSDTFSWFDDRSLDWRLSKGFGRQIPSGESDYRVRWSVINFSAVYV